MSAYKKGYRIELRAKKELKELGAELIVRSAASKTPSDLIAIFPNKKEIWLIQCKKAGTTPKKQETIQKRFKQLKKLEGQYKLKTYLYTWNNKKKKYDFIPI